MCFVFPSRFAIACALRPKNLAPGALQARKYNPHIICLDHLSMGSRQMDHTRCRSKMGWGNHPAHVHTHADQRNKHKHNNTGGRCPSAYAGQAQHHFASLCIILKYVHAHPKLGNASARDELLAHLSLKPMALGNLPT